MNKKNDLNLSKINDILKSEPTKLFNFDVTEKEKRESSLRKIGDKWEDENGNIWEQKDGYKIKVSKNHETMQAIRDSLSMPTLCPKCNKKMSKWQDREFYNKNKMCMDCTIAYEHELKLEGKYDEYAKKRIRENALSWLKDAEQEIEILKDSFKTEYVNEDGSIEKWEYPIPPEKMKIELDKKFKEFKKSFLQKLG